MRLLLTVVVGLGTFMLALIALGAAGVNAAYIQAPVSIFIAAMALWPVVKPVMTDRFKDYAAYQVTVLIVAMVVIYAAEKYLAARALLQ